MMNGKTRQNILVDTSIPLEGGEELITKLEKVAPVFVTDIVLQELDGHKNNANTSVAYRAREFFRRLGSSNGEALFVLPPDGMRLEKTDSLRKMKLGDTPLYVLVRKPYKSRDINDSKIIEIAKDYNMILVTLDTAQRVRGLSDGVEAITLEAILPAENFKEGLKMEQEMSEVEKLMKKTEMDNKEKAEFPFGATIGFLALGAICSLGADSFWATFGVVSVIILFFAFVSYVAKPMSTSEYKNKFGESTVENSSSTVNNKVYSALDLNLRNDIVR